MDFDKEFGHKNVLKIATVWGYFKIQLHMFVNLKHYFSLLWNAKHVK